MTTLTQDQHDRAVRFIAANRYPFPDQPHPSWPLHYRTWVNTATHPRRSIDTPDGPHFPDIMIVDGENATREIGEVEMDFGPGIATRWKAASEAADDTTETGARHLLVYVPEGREDEALAILEGNDISFHALRGVRVDDDGSVHVLPHRTIGNGKDHRPNSPPPVAEDPVVETPGEDEREAVMRFLLAERFPFPGEGTAQWGLDLYPITNTRLHARRAIPGPGGALWPSVVVVDAAERPCKIGMVEIDVSEASIPAWRAMSETAVYEGHYTDPDNGKGAKHFLLYVPLGREDAAREMVKAAGISCAGVRGYEVTEAGRVRMPAILPPTVPA
ncbi:hypothetical protein SAMN05444336_11239 [Albimonas donghaensis]|uniref:Uncharacterized protein n=1 Tax=Albimonas donghaensis TaxID=356660 RepID=A0A1H3FB39_9RHOB|nr:hypothetical protein [Albimonas donghaensis]SDX88263.1 hypothetical protein SAMN05444336_11239 [Albimonas donghaensis]